MDGWNMFAFADDTVTFVSDTKSPILTANIGTANTVNTLKRSHSETTKVANKFIICKTGIDREYVRLTMHTKQIRLRIIK